MRKSRSTEQQLVGAVKQIEAGAPARSWQNASNLFAPGTTLEYEPSFNFRDLKQFAIDVVRPQA